jgi:tetratricopeptide (TPR) repeat protein
MGAFLLRYKNTKLRFFYMIGIFWRGTFHAPAMVMLPLWFGEQLFFALLAGGLGDGQGGGVAYWAHVGGFAFGFGTALTMKRWRIEEQYLASKIDSKVNRTLVDNRVVEQALAAQSRGETQQAYDLLRREQKRAPANREVALALWSVALDLGQAADAARGMLRTIQQDLRTGESVLALENWEALESRGQREEAVVALRRALLSAGRCADATVALKIAQLSKGLDVVIARGAARLALSKPGLDREAKARAEQILAELPPASPAAVAFG